MRKLKDILIGSLLIATHINSSEIETNADLVSRLLEYGDQMVVAHMGEFFADTVKIHSGWSDGKDVDLDTLTKQETGRVEALLGEKWEIVDAFFFDDKFVSYCRCHGVHVGEYEGLPATNTKFQMTGILMYRFKEGKICEVWSSFDKLSLLRQLGEVKITPKPQSTTPNHQ